MSILITYRKSILILCSLSLFTLCCSQDDSDSILEIKNFPNRTNDFSLWQLDSFFGEVQMGYILRADDGKIIVIDGGGKLTAPILKRYLLKFGGKVDTWIITHPHSDHVDSFLEIVKDDHITINQILHVPLPNAWVEKNEIQNFESILLYNHTLETLKKIKVLALSPGDTFLLATGLRMEVLSGYNEEITLNAINNSSMAFKIASKSKTILFLGDLGEQGGEKLLQNIDNAVLKSDYVQMSHHGQSGVNKDFYKAVDANYALWPTPKWLWNNQSSGRGIDSGNFKTLLVRKWMDDLGIKRNYVSGLEGNLQID